jgi:hypothetical protein
MVLVRALYVCFHVCPDLQNLCEILELRPCESVVPENS